MNERYHHPHHHHLEHVCLLSCPSIFSLLYLFSPIFSLFFKVFLFSYFFLLFSLFFIFPPAPFHCLPLIFLCLHCGPCFPKYYLSSSTFLNFFSSLSTCSHHSPDIHEYLPSSLPSCHLVKSVSQHCSLCVSYSHCLSVLVCFVYICIKKWCGIIVASPNSQGFTGSSSWWKLFGFFF